MAIIAGDYDFTVQRRADHTESIRITDSSDSAVNLTGFTSEELDSMFAKEEIEITDPIDVGDDENHLLNDVKMIQLFYEPENEQKFRNIVDKIKEQHNIDNISDAVLMCVLNEGKKLKE